VRLLLLNPNASGHITERLAASARAELGPGDELLALTNPDGPPVVRDAPSLARAEAGTAGLMAAHIEGCDAFVLGLSLDGSIDGLRPAWRGKPALGMTEAAVACAALTGGRVGLLTIGPGLAPLYRARLACLLPDSRVAGVQAPDLPRAFEADAGVDPAVIDALAASARALQADAFVLAGAVLCGYEAPLRAALGKPVFDGVRAAVRLVRALRPA